LTHLAFQLTGNGLAIGRFDQHVGPYLTADLERGVITLDEAAELTHCFMLKFNERSVDNSVPRTQADFGAARARDEAAWAKRFPFAHDTKRNNLRDGIDATNHWLQNVVIGGVKPEDGADASNPVTYMVLDAFEQNRMTNPCLTVRLHAGTPQALYRRLIDALNRNFEGYGALRGKLLAAPKYGRGEKAADEMGARLLKEFARKVRELNPKYPKITYLPGAGTFSWYIAIGEGVGASPDGRLSGEAVSSNLSPAAGAATRGVTGAILSHASFDMADLPVGSPNDLRLSGRQVEGEEGLIRLMGVVKGFVELGGNMLTLTVADTAELREAQRHPERYRDLRVRMGGWSAYFTMLSRDQQDHHIAKQETL